MPPAPWRPGPLIYEINTWTWLHGLSAARQEAVTLGTVPDETLDALAAWGFDAVWLMGVWERSPLSRQVARQHPDLQEGYRRALPDFAAEDVIGSPFAVRRYAVDPALGGPQELTALRARLAARGLKLILDYVPNHVARDHEWLHTAPECIVQGAPDDLAAQPGNFFAGPGGRVFAHGRDPHFAGWTDTAQINAFSPAARNRAATTLLEIAGQCDGLRCDMAMLVSNRVFAQTWGQRAGSVPEAEFWEVVIPAVKEQNPDFLFLAEVYWDLEWELLAQGFDYAYDKRLYDRLVEGSARAIGEHLRADLVYQRHMVRFTENHDERRAAEALGPGRERAAAALIATLPGAALLHEGQLAGHRVRLPVQLGRRPAEPDDAAALAFYRALLAEAGHPVYHEGAWRLREATPAWDLNATHRSLIAFTWQAGEERRLVVVNYSAASAQGRVRLPDLGLEGRAWTLHDALDGAGYERGGDEMVYDGLYVDLRPWAAHVLSFR
jgi:hypothetical protein